MKQDNSENTIPKMKNSEKRTILKKATSENKKT